jgi:hypothetical protein
LLTCDVVVDGKSMITGASIDVQCG